MSARRPSRERLLVRIRRRLAKALVGGLVAGSTATSVGYFVDARSLALAFVFGFAPTFLAVLLGGQMPAAPDYDDGAR